MKKIDKPKVFISYAWGSEEYQRKVLLFASNLVGDGIEVVLDKWDLTEGNDTYYFMEKCVNDDTITNVLILLDPIYEKKANDHTGGVGTETQIISPEVYEKVTQNKFIPIVMERNEYGEVCKPTYLNGKLHFDLSLPDSYDEEYRRLVKRLYGEEIYRKPELGKKPNWVEEPISLEVKSVIKYDTIRQNKNEKVNELNFENYLEEIKNRLCEYVIGDGDIVKEDQDYIAMYDETNNIKMDFLNLVKNSLYIENSFKYIAAFFEETKNIIGKIRNRHAEIVSVRLHELFIYVVAYYLHNKEYSNLGRILCKTYFDENTYINSSGARSFSMFFSGQDQDKLDDAVNKRDGKNYLTGTGQYWIETLRADFCSKEEFVFADVICFNYSVYGKSYMGEWRWFPITYIYENNYASKFATMSKRLISEEYALNIMKIFGYDNLNDFKEKIKFVQDDEGEEYRSYRYQRTFDSARLIKDYIKYDEIASVG